MDSASQPYDWRKRRDLVSLRNVTSEEKARVSGGRLFHARTAVTGRHELSLRVEFYLYPTVGTVLIHSVKPELTE